MRLYDLVSYLRTDLDDTNESSQFFSDKELCDFIFRSLFSVNNHLRFSKKYQFIVFEKYKDVYELNSDFVSFRNSVNVKDQVKVKWNKLTDMLDKTFDPLILNIQINEQRRKIYFNDVPTVDVEAYSVNETFDTNGNISVLQIYSSYSDILNYSFSPFVLYNGSVYRIADDETTTYNQDGTDYSAVNLYVSEKFDVKNTQFSDSLLRFVDVILNYTNIINPADYYYSYPYQITVTANSTALTAVSWGSSNLDPDAGDSLWIDGFPSREISTLSFPTITLKNPFSTILPATATNFSCYVIKMNSDISAPNELMNVVVEYAKYFAFLKAEDPRSAGQLQFALAMIEEENRRQVTEILHHNNSDSKKYELDYLDDYLKDY